MLLNDLSIAFLPSAIGGQVNIALEGVDDDTTLFGGGASMAAQSSLANFARNSEQADSGETNSSNIGHVL